MSEVIQYMVRDPQGSVYGPAPMDLIGQWVREGRITAGMQLAPEGSVDWKPAAAYPELREFFSPEAVVAALGQSLSPAMPPEIPVNPYAATLPTTPGPPTTAPAPMAGGQVNVLAIISLVVPLFGCGCCPIAIVGVVLGVLAKKQIKESAGAQTGDGLATAGIIVGAIACLVSGCVNFSWLRAGWMNR